MLLQLVIVSLAILLAAAYVVRHSVRAWRGKGSCGCGGGSCPKEK